MGFSIERAVTNDFQALADVIVAVWEQIEIKDWFVADDSKNIHYLLREENGIGYKAIVKDSGILAGIFLATFPGKQEENLGWDIGLPEEELEQVAHMESIAILSEYRGHGLQYSLMQTAEEELRQRGYRYLMCTIHPDNVYSKNNAIRQGYEVVMTKEKYGGFIRDILLKKIT
jgi:ribosomal protein S18 acetylase RimI-like enzyme